jgi:hypothetical protein
LIGVPENFRFAHQYEVPFSLWKKGGDEARSLNRVLALLMVSALTRA